MQERAELARDKFITKRSPVLRRDGDKVVEMDVLGKDPGEILTITECGFGKRTSVDEYRLQTRGGTGVINIKTTEKNGKVVAITCVAPDDEVLLITKYGKMIRVACSTIRSVGRSTQGVKLIQLEKEDAVVSAVKLVEKENGEEELPGDDQVVSEEESITEPEPPDSDPIH